MPTTVPSFLPPDDDKVTPTSHDIETGDISSQQSATSSALSDSDEHSRSSDSAVNGRENTTDAVTAEEMTSEESRREQKGDDDRVSHETHDDDSDVSSAGVTPDDNTDIALSSPDDTPDRESEKAEENIHHSDVDVTVTVSSIGVILDEEDHASDVASDDARRDRDADSDADHSGGDSVSGGGDTHETVNDDNRDDGDGSVMEGAASADSDDDSTSLETGHDVNGEEEQKVHDADSGDAVDDVNRDGDDTHEETPVEGEDYFLDDEHVLDGDSVALNGGDDFSSFLQQTDGSVIVMEIDNFDDGAGRSRTGWQLRHDPPQFVMRTRDVNYPPIVLSPTTAETMVSMLKRVQKAYAGVSSPRTPVEGSWWQRFVAAWNTHKTGNWVLVIALVVLIMAVFIL